MEKVICIFGASSTWGAWDPEKGGWVNRLRLFLESENYDVFIYNLGVSGNTTNDLLNRFETEAEARHPNIIIFSIGDNDSIHIKPKNKQMVSLQQFEKNLQKLVQKSKKFANIIIFLGCKKVDENKTTPLPWKTGYSYTNQNLTDYNQKIKKIAQKNRVFYLDIFDLLKNEDLADGLHPNSRGHQKLFLEVKDFLLGKKLI